MELILKYCEFLLDGHCKLGYHNGFPHKGNCRACIEANENKKGLGDRVERIAQPIARIIDKVAGTNIKGCGACKKRKQYLNKKFPNT
jgi:hypothetical protein